MRRTLELVLSTAALALAAPVAAQTTDVDRIEAQAASRAAMQQSWQAQREAQVAQREAVGAEAAAGGSARQAQREAMRAQREAVRGAGSADWQAQREAVRAQRDAARGAGSADLQAQREAARAQRDAARGAGAADWRGQRKAMRSQRDAALAERAAAVAQADAARGAASAPQSDPARDAALQQRGAEFRDRYRRSLEARTAAGRAAGVTSDLRVPADVLERGYGRGTAADGRRGAREDWRQDRRETREDGRQDRRVDRRDVRDDRRDDIRRDRRDGREDVLNGRRDRRWADSWARRGWDPRWSQQRFDRYGRPFDWNRGRRYVWGYNLDPRFSFGSQWLWDPYWTYDQSWWGSYGYYDGYRNRDGWGQGVRTEDLVRSDPIVGRWALTRFDRDRSGWLGPNETVEASRAVRQLADTNNDGRINDREYRFALERLEQLAYSAYGFDDDLRY